MSEEISVESPSTEAVQNIEGPDSAVRLTLNMNKEMLDSLTKLSELYGQDRGTSIRDAIATLIKLLQESREGYTEVVMKNPRNDEEKFFHLISAMDRNRSRGPFQALRDHLTPSR